MYRGDLINLDWSLIAFRNQNAFEVAVLRNCLVSSAYWQADNQFMVNFGNKQLCDSRSTRIAKLWTTMERLFASAILRFLQRKVRKIKTVWPKPDRPIIRSFPNSLWIHFEFILNLLWIRFVTDIYQFRLFHFQISDFQRPFFVTAQLFCSSEIAFLIFWSENFKSLTGL